VNSLTTAVIVLVCLSGGAMLGIALRARLPKHHITSESTDAIKLATGLMATLAALVLGLLISSANAERTTVQNAYVTGLTNVATLDRHLAEYGTETQQARALLRHALLRRFQAIWPSEDFGPQEPANGGDINAIGSMEHELLKLSPASDSQKWLLPQALQATNNLEQVRWSLMSRGAGFTLPVPFLIVLVCWSTAIFISFGLLARPNITVLVSLLMAALAVSAAIFLILDLSNPFAGLMQVSSAPAHAMLNALGK
jgi:hypothetical protein